jgi:lipoic acid synthetase
MLEMPPDAAGTAFRSIPLDVRAFRRVVYGEALEEQRRLHAARCAGEIADTLLLMEHQPVYTLGRRSDPTHILMSDDFLHAQGATVVRNERGGEVTYHGPGQLMAYPIIQLRAHERSLTLLVDRLEETIMRTLADFGVQGQRQESDRGVWVGDRKIASIGMAVRRWVVMHGVGLNVTPDLRYFSYIDPCGHRDLQMTSMAQELGSTLPLEAVADSFVAHFCAVFGRTPLVSDDPEGATPRRNERVPALQDQVARL